MCCWRPNPLLQCFYLALVIGGATLYLYNAVPHIPNPRLSYWHWPASCLAVAS